MAKITVVPSTIGVSLTNLSTLSGSGGVGSVDGSIASVVGGAIVGITSVGVTMVVGVPVVGGAIVVIGLVGVTMVAGVTVVGGAVVVILEMKKFCLTFFSQSVGLILTDLGISSLVMNFM